MPDTEKTWGDDALGPRTLEEKKRFIEDSADALFHNILGLIGEADKDVSQKQAETLGAIFTLASVGLHALVELADAQQRMATLAEIDVGETIRHAVEEATAVKVAEEMEAKTKRSFIGKPPLI